MPKTQTQTVSCRILRHSFHAKYFCNDIGGFRNSFYGFLLGEGLTAVPTRLGPPLLGNSIGFFPGFGVAYHLDDQGRRMRQPQYLPQRVRPNIHERQIKRNMFGQSDG